MIVCPKVNLFLEITARRPDGFHEIETVMQTVSNVADALTAEPAAGLALAVEDLRAPVPEAPAGGGVLPDARPGGGALPADERNLVLRAARALQNRWPDLAAGKGAKFFLRKRIPDGAGLGGGSADAAAALVLLNDLWKMRRTREELALAAADVGSDVAFFLYGGTALCRGRGEVITPLPVPPVAVTLLVPPWKINTAAAYRELRQGAFARHPAAPFVELLSRGTDGRALAEAGFNLFTEAAARLEPRQRELADALRAAGVKGRLSGSGSCWWLPELDAVARAGLEAEFSRRPALSGIRLL